MELVITGTLDLLLCSFFHDLAAVLRSHVQGMCTAGTRLGAGEGEAVPSQAAGQSCFTHLPGPSTVTGGHRTFGSHRLLGGLEKLTPDQCKEILTALQALTSPHYCLFSLL